MKTLPWRLGALLLALVVDGAGAERTPLRAPVPTDAGATRVIVKLKDGSSLMRAHALAAGSTRQAVATALDRRATALGARHGVRLQAGAALANRVQIVQGEGIEARHLAALLARDGEVEYAEVDRRVRRALVPNDPRFASVSGNGPAAGQWYLKAPAGEVLSSIDAVSAWDTTIGSASVVVAVLDTGVRIDHPDLAAKLLPGYDLVSDAAIANDGDGRDGDASDPGDWVTSAEAATPTYSDCEVASSSWHGTQIAGLIGAATGNGVGMAGAGWDVRVLPVRVLGKCFGYTADVVSGIRWAAGLAVPGLPLNPNPARVINLSLGSGDACTNSEREAIAEATAAGVVVVAAAGNTAGLAANSPANCPGVIGVAALRHVGTKVGFSDVGPELSIAAPGGNCVNPSGACLYPVLTTVDSGVTTPASPTYTDSFDASVGTSFSSPLVAATAALMLSVQGSLTPAGVRAAMQATARPFPSSGVAGDPIPIVACHAPDGREQLQCYCTPTTCGAGMLDAGAAVRAATGIRVVIEVTPPSPTAGQAIMLSGSTSTVAPGRSIAAWQWSLVDAGSTGSVFEGGTEGATATLTPTAAGTVVVRLALTDDRGAAVAEQRSVTVAPAAAPAAGADADAGGGSGGGALSWPWLLGLLMAVRGLATPPSRRRRTAQGT
ncbi:MAG TPA: S8 family peptidase [Burkholderiaceae bacterium]